MDFLFSIFHQLESLISPEAIAGYVDILGPFIYLLIFIVAFFESFIFTGLLLPGTLMLLATGFIASQGPVSFLLLFCSTAVAAILGDIVNFYLGRTKGEGLILAVSGKFRIKTDYLKIGEDFFMKHGDKSVFIGRFVAIIRPFIPFVAGIFKMRWKIFLFWNVLSGLAWSGLYLTLGYFFGTALQSVVTWSGRAGAILLVIMIFAIVTHFVKKRSVVPKHSSS